jgi:hypothetical protein
VKRLTASASAAKRPHPSLPSSIHLVPSFLVCPRKLVHIEKCIFLHLHPEERRFKMLPFYRRQSRQTKSSYYHVPAFSAFSAYSFINRLYWSKAGNISKL